MRFKALATDIDGTITTKEDLLDERAMLTIRKLERAGIPVVLCSSASLTSVLSLKHYIGTTAPVIAEEGAVIATGLDSFQVFGSRGCAERAAEFLKRRFELVPKPGNRYRCVSLSFQRTFCWRAAAEELKREGIKARIMDTGWAFHLSDPSIDKGFGLRKVARTLRIPLKRIAAIGDYYNDIPMLRVAGYGIAVGQAPAELKSIANYVCRQTYAKGFVEGIRHVFGI
jgi:hypothetical protein